MSIIIVAQKLNVQNAGSWHKEIAFSYLFKADKFLLHDTQEADGCLHQGISDNYIF